MRDRNFSLVPCASYCSALTLHILMRVYRLVEFLSLVFTCMPGESCCRHLQVFIVTSLCRFASAVMDSLCLLIRMLHSGPEFEPCGTGPLPVPFSSNTSHGVHVHCIDSHAGWKSLEASQVLVVVFLYRLSVVVIITLHLPILKLCEGSEFSVLTLHILMSVYLLVEFMSLVFTCMPGESYRRNHSRPLLSCSCVVVRVL